MGYRSDVAIGMAFSNREAVTAFLTSARLSDKISPEELAHYTVTDAGELGVLLHASFLDVKWYESYPDVQSHTRLLGKARDSGAGTAFIRIGEDYNDIEVDIDTADVDVDLYDFFGVSRQLNCPDPGASITDFLNENKE